MNKIALIGLTIVAALSQTYAADSVGLMDTTKPSIQPTQTETLTVEAVSPTISKLSIAGSFGYESAYVFRGAKCADSSFQASVEAGYPVLGGDIHAGLWTNQPIASGQSNEIDLYLGWTKPLTDSLTFDLGYTYYWYADTETGLLRSNELYLGVVFDTSKTLGGVNLNPAIAYYYDWNLEAHTIELSMGYSFDLSDIAGVEGLSLDPNIYLGWSARGMPSAEWGPHQWSSGIYYGLSLNLNYRLNDDANVYIGGRWAGICPTNENASNPQQLWGGAGVNFCL